MIDDGVRTSRLENRKTRPVVFNHWCDCDAESLTDGPSNLRVNKRLLERLWNVLRHLGARIGQWSSYGSRHSCERVQFAKLQSVARIGEWCGEGIVPWMVLTWWLLYQHCTHASDLRPSLLFPKVCKSTTMATSSTSSTSSTAWVGLATGLVVRHRRAISLNCWGRRLSNT